MLKSVRIIIGGLLVVVGIVLTIIPGSTLLILAGLVLLSYDIPTAKRWLAYVQKGMSRSARRLDRFLLERKYR